MSLARTVQSTGRGIVNLSRNFGAGSNNVTRPYNTYYIDTTAGASTMIADPAPIPNDEYLFKDKGGSAGTNNISFDPNGKTLDGVSGVSVLIAVNRGWARIKYNGSEWSLV